MDNRSGAYVLIVGHTTKVIVDSTLVVDPGIKLTTSIIAACDGFTTFPVRDMRHYIGYSAGQFAGAFVL